MTFSKISKKLIKIAFIFFLAIVVPAHAAELDARLDRDQAVEGEPVVLTLSTDGGTDGMPDLSSLQRDFDLVNQGQSNSMSIINGRMSSRREWRLTLMPKRTGTIEIPSIPFGNGQSEPLTLEVLPAAAAAQRGADLPVMVEAEIEPASPYVQQQLVYTVRILHAVPLRDANLSQPQVDGALVYPLGDGSRFETYRNGRKYQAIERRFAVLPQQSGELTVAGPVLTARIPESGQSPGQQLPGGNLRDRFFGNDPFAGMFGQSRPVQYRAPEKRVDVRPQPAGTASPWLPAESLKLNETWSPDLKDLRVGEPVTRIVAITAQGLADEQLPELDIGAGADGVKIYPDKPQANTRPDNDTLVSQKVLRAAIVPQRPGRLALPELTLRWWDVTEGRERIARVPARTVDIAPATGGTQVEPSRPQAAAPTDAVSATGWDTEPTGGEASSRSPRQVPSGSGQTLWQWLAIAFAIAWLVAMGLWWRARQRGGDESPGQTAATAPEPGRVKTDLDQVAVAFETNDPRRARQSLIDWGSAQWPDAAIHDLDAMGQRLPADAREVIMQIDNVLFGFGQSSWDGRAAWQRLRPLLPESPARRSQRDGGADLPPLYPTG